MKYRCFKKAAVKQLDVSQKEKVKIQKIATAFPF
jgi:hypothetical protein